ncbi:MAG: hypothetical protein WCF26_26455, partial [Candidatus Sulfotelmatobacter sp.]
SQRVRMEGWRQEWRSAERETLVQRKNNRTHLTPTGLLMEGHFAHVEGACFDLRSRRIPTVSNMSDDMGPSTG